MDPDETRPPRPRSGVQIKKEVPSDPLKTVLSRIRVILVEPQGPRNVGSTARAMRNFGLSRLVLVKGPSLEHPETKEMASGAQDVLAGAIVCDTLEEAVADCQFLVGTTARPRHRLETLLPHDAAPKLIDAASAGLEVGILFGREDSGLTAEEMRLCHFVISAATAEDYASLNLAQAVLLIAHEIFAASGARTITATRERGRVLDAEWRAVLIDEMLRALEKLRVVHDRTVGPYRQSLERVLTAGPIETRDARVLFALARHAQAVADPSNPGTRPPRRPPAHKILTRSSDDLPDRAPDAPPDPIELSASEGSSAPNATSSGIQSPTESP